MCKFVDILKEPKKCNNGNIEKYLLVSMYSVPFARVLVLTLLDHPISKTKQTNKQRKMIFFYKQSLMSKQLDCKSV